MDHSQVTNEFITNYLNQLEYNDFVSILDKIHHKCSYTSGDIDDVISKLDDQKRSEVIKKIMHKYPELTMDIIESDFLHNIDWEKVVPFISNSIVLDCIYKNPTILNSILKKPTDAQKTIIDDCIQLKLKLKKYIKENPKNVINQLLNNNAFSSGLSLDIWMKINSMNDIGDNTTTTKTTP